MKRFMNVRLLVVCTIILAAALSRLLPHPPNFAPITAVALFGGAYLGRRMAFVIPLAALTLSDLVIQALYGYGIYSGMYFTYLAFIGVVGIGILIREKLSAGYIALAAVASSVFFFTVTNFGVWTLGMLYPRTLDGLVMSYTAALPFFQNTFLGDMVYTTILFGGFALAGRRVPALRQQSVQ